MKARLDRPRTRGGPFGDSGKLVRAVGAMRRRGRQVTTPEQYCYLALMAFPRVKADSDGRKRLLALARAEGAYEGPLEIRQRVERDIDVSAA